MSTLYVISRPRRLTDRQAARPVLGQLGMTRIDTDEHDRRDESEPPHDRPFSEDHGQDPPTKPNDPTGKELTTPDETLGG